MVWRAWSCFAGELGANLWPAHTPALTQTKPWKPNGPVNGQSTYLPKVDCDWSPVFSKFGVLGLGQWGWYGLWQWVFCRGRTAILGDVLWEEGRSRLALGSWSFALLLHSQKPRGLLRTTPRLSKSAPLGEAEEEKLIWPSDTDVPKKPKLSTWNYKHNFQWKTYFILYSSVAIFIFTHSLCLYADI